MDENMIAICLYIGILLMAGAVLVLTIIYFVRPPATRTGVVKTETNKGLNETPDEMGPKMADTRQSTEGKAPALVFDENNSEKPVELTKGSETKKISAIKLKPAAGINESEKKDMNRFKIRLGKRKTEKSETPFIRETRLQEQDEKMPLSKLINKSVNREIPLAVAPTGVTQAKTAVAQKKDILAKSEPEDKNYRPNHQITLAMGETQPREKQTELPKVEISPSAQNSVKSIVAEATPNLEEKDKDHIEKANVELVKKESEVKMDIKNVEKAHSETDNLHISESSAKPAVIVTNIEAKKTPEQKSSLDDLSKMFSKEVTDDNEATKLAKDMKDVEIDSLLKDGNDLVNLLKRFRS